MSRELVRCKACGYIMDAKHLGDLCPACGVKAKMFEPYTPRMNEKRMRILDLHIHPIVVHLPQAFAVIFVVLSIILVSLCPCGRFNWRVIETMKLLAYAYPFVVLGGMISGIVDAKVRFRKISAPALRLKVVFGTAFILFAAAIPLSFKVFPMFPLAHRILLVFLSLSALVASAVLGKIGAGLNDTGFPN